MTGAELAWRAEETCLNAWPALRQVLLGGWVLRFSDGLTRRANSANPLGLDRADGHTLIAGCERLYRYHRLPTIFRLPSIIGPGLDQRLAALGYAGEGLSLVLHGRIGAIAAACDPGVQLRPHPSRAWFAAMAALQNQTAGQSRTYRRIVRQLAVPAAFAALPAEGGIAALAYGALHNGLMCYESVVTNRHLQRRGYARRIVASLAAWAREKGAEGVCLEVEAGNRSAIALYDAIGIGTELYRYHYRREPPAAAHKE